MTDATAQIKDYFEKVLKKEVVTFLCGDFNSGSKSGMYDFMRSGEYDCLKLNRNEISGQYHGSYTYKDKISAFSMLKSIMNLDTTPTLKDQGRIYEWYTEIINTFPEMQYDEDTCQPNGKFIPRTTVPFEKINMKFKRPKSVECEEYLKLVNKYIDEKVRQGMKVYKILNQKDRPFFKLKNNCGPFKSAYAQNMLNHVHYINAFTKKNYPLEYLDHYQFESQDAILDELLN